MSGELHPNRPEFGTEDFRRYAALSNDVGRMPLRSGAHLRFSDRCALADYLWAQGWRREVCPEDVTECPAPRPTTEGGSSDEH